MDRLLPFDFTVVLEHGRTLLLADYLSRHLSEYNGSTIKSEDLLNSWFTINVVNEISPASNKKSTKENQLIRNEECAKGTKLTKESVLTVYRPVQSSVKYNQTIGNPIIAEMKKIFQFLKSVGICSSEL